MYKLKKLTRALALALALTITAPAGLPVSSAVVCEAATIKLSASKKTLEVGKSFTLQVKGTKKKVTWSTSKKSVATVSQKGKVTAKKAGTATITAKVGGKSYKCKVTVKNPVNKYVAKAPFKAKEATIGKYTIAIPKSWKMEKVSQNNMTVYVLVPENADIYAGSSNVSVTVNANDGAVQSNLETWKAYLQETITKEFVEAAFGGLGTVTDFSMEEKEINLGKAIVTSYTVEMDVNGQKSTVKQAIYDVFCDGYVTEITITDNGAAVEPDVHTVGEYIANSLVYKK